jgi:arylsulfatase A-like enzyme/Flp pilus assembly protein TadD
VCLGFALLALLALLGLWRRGGGAPSKRPNVLLVTFDTLRADRVGALGGPPGLTPNLDRLAATGAVFEEALASTPLTLPSHATIFSGLLPPRHGVRDNGSYVVPADLETAATRLRSAGYATGAFVGAYVLDRRFGLARGFDHYDDRIVRQDARKSLLEAERRGEEVAGAAVGWLAQQTGPFFAWVHLYDPHAPYEAPASFRERFPKAPYDAEVAYADECLGRALEAARVSSARAGKELLVVVLADHGESLGEHGELTHGLFVYQSTLRVPLIVAGPGVAAGERRPGPARTADVLPTLLGRLGMAVPSGLDGVDLFAVSPPREAYAESDYPRSFGWAGLRSLRLGPLKLVEGGARAELYDLAADPAEEHDRAEARLEDVARLRQALAALRRSERAAARAPASAESAERLRALGYVTSGGGVAAENEGDPPRPHPRDRIDAYRAFEEASWAEVQASPGTGVPGLERALAADPANPVFRRALAAALRRAGRNAAAAELLGAAGGGREAAPDWHERALALAAAGRVREAEESDRKALDLDPLLPEAHNHLGVLLAGQARADEALQHFEAATSLDPNNAQAWSNLANALRDLGRAPQAEAAYRRASELDPQSPDPWNGLGVLAVQSGRAEEAIGLFQKALALDPQLGEARLNLAVALVQGGRVDEARATLAPLLSARGDTADKARRLHRELAR